MLVYRKVGLSFGSRRQVNGSRTDHRFPLYYLDISGNIFPDLYDLAHAAV